MDDKLCPISLAERADAGADAFASGNVFDVFSCSCIALYCTEIVAPFVHKRAVFEVFPARGLSAEIHGLFLISRMMHGELNPREGFGAGRIQRGDALKAMFFVIGVSDDVAARRNFFATHGKIQRLGPLEGPV